MIRGASQGGRSSPTGSEYTVIDRPDVRYAHDGDVAIAYQVFGQGTVNLVCVPGAQLTGDAG